MGYIFSFNFFKCYNTRRYALSISSKIFNYKLHSMVRKFLFHFSLYCCQFRLSVNNFHTSRLVAVLTFFGMYSLTALRKRCKTESNDEFINLIININPCYKYKSTDSFIHHTMLYFGFSLMQIKEWSPKRY